MPAAGFAILQRANSNLLSRHSDVYSCRNCGSQNIVKNGRNAYGNQQFWCKDCSKRGVLQPKRSCSLEQKEQILSAYSERSSMRGIQCTCGVVGTP